MTELPAEEIGNRLLGAANQRIQRLEAALERHSAFRTEAIDLVRDMRLALLQGTYLIKQQMDSRSDAWLKKVDGPHPTRSTIDGEVNAN